MVRLGAEGMCVKWALFVCLLATLPARSLLVPLEAAFQGRFHLFHILISSLLLVQLKMTNKSNYNILLVQDFKKW